MFPFLCIFFSRLLREQWIRAKYERKEFIHSEKQEPYSAGSERHFWQIKFFVQHLPFYCHCLYVLSIGYRSYVTKSEEKAWYFGEGPSWPSLHLVWDIGNVNT